MVSDCQCFFCRYYEGSDRYPCPAFIEGIPSVIQGNRFDHRKPYPGDNGIRYEPADGVPSSFHPMD